MRNGELLKEGDIIKRPKMAKTLRRIAEDEFTFYNGSLALDIVKDIAEYGKNNTQINVNYIKTVKIQGQFMYTYIINLRSYQLVFYVIYQEGIFSFLDGNITLEDLAAYTAIEKPPLNVTLEHGNYTVYASRPPASGALYAFILNVLKRQFQVNSTFKFSIYSGNKSVSKLLFSRLT